MNNTTELHKSKIKIDYGELRYVMEWCRQNCNHDWHISDVAFDMVSNISNYEFTFNDEQDVIMFELRWR